MRCTSNNPAPGMSVCGGGGGGGGVEPAWSDTLSQHERMQVVTVRKLELSGWNSKQTFISFMSSTCACKRVTIIIVSRPNE